MPRSILLRINSEKAFARSCVGPAHREVVACSTATWSSWKRLIGYSFGVGVNVSTTGAKSDDLPGRFRDRSPVLLMSGSGWFAEWRLIYSTFQNPDHLKHPHLMHNAPASHLDGEPKTKNGLRVH
jgi:hypothetical protein